MINLYMSDDRNRVLFNNLARQESKDSLHLTG
jgi:hypothetical protein